VLYIEKSMLSFALLLNGPLKVVHVFLSLDNPAMAKIWGSSLGAAKPQEPSFLAEDIVSVLSTIWRRMEIQLNTEKIEPLLSVVNCRR